MSGANKVVASWLVVVCVTIFAMIVVGGVTRLTHSGLSMVDWQPLMGVIPPVGESEWQDTFLAYQQYPEYQKVNAGMSLDEFKAIFYWEYGHRVLGRLIGLVFFLPFVVFWASGKIEKRYLPRLIVALLLGACQGLMGWYMVMSGLVDEPRVSHFRLAAHLVLALLILAYLFWIILDLMGVLRVGTGAIRNLSIVLLGVTSVQIIYGAFTAGLRAGLGFNTYPLMDGQLIADAATMMSPQWQNFLHNGVMVQFVHRWLGALVLVLVSVLAGYCFRENKLKAMSVLVLVITLAQFVLGILTLVNYVPLGLASIHQALACFVLLSMVATVYRSRVPVDTGHAH